MADKIRVGQIGVGHAHAAGKMGVLRESSDWEVVGVHEADEEVWRQRGRHPAYSGVRRVGLDELLGDTTIQVIAVESRVEENMAHARAAILAGKHIHLDKPPGGDLVALRSLFDEAVRRHLVIQMGYMWRYNEGVEAVLEAAARGWLGKVYMVRAQVNTDLGPASRRGVARFRGGMMYELGCHLIDRVVAVLGRPLKVHGWLRHDSDIDDELADNTLAVFEYERALAVITSTAQQHGAHDVRAFEVLGDRGTASVSPLEAPNVRIGLRQPVGPYKRGWQDVDVKPTPRYVRDMQELARVVRREAAPSFTPEHDLIAHDALLQACRMT